VEKPDVAAVSLEARLAATRRAHGRRARRNKFAYRALWWPVFLIIWALLFLRLGAAPWQVTDPAALRIAEYVIAGLSLTMFVLTACNLLMGFREAWIDNRVASEMLRIFGLLYQFGAGRYDRPDAAKELEKDLTRVGHYVEKGWLGVIRHRVLPYLGLLWRRQPKIRPGEVTPLGESVDPRFADEQLVAPEAEDRVLDYLHHQRSWHYDKARAYVWGYVTLQVLIMAVSIAVAGLNLWNGPESGCSSRRRSSRWA
jgi:Protein of unknown function (DUF4231)